MLGAFLNALGILIGALCGLALRQPLTARAQAFLKTALAAFTFFYGLRLMYENFHGSLMMCLRQFLLAALAVVAGYWLGRLLRLQPLSNRAGHQAAIWLAAAQKHPPGTSATGFVAATVLFCAAPLGLVGAVADGLENYFYLLLVKAVMDGLAMMTFVKMFRWPVALAAAPVFFFFNGLSLLVQRGAAPWLETQGLATAVGLTAGLLTCLVALVILEVRRVELANYLPALALAPLLTHWLG